MKSIPIKESSIQKSILSWGNANRILMHRINVIGTPYIRHRKTYYRPAQNTGMADILCIHLIENIPVNVWLEVKTKTGKLSPSQIAFKNTIEAYSGYYFIVRSIEDVESALKQVEIFTWENINKATERQSWKMK